MAKIQSIITGRDSMDGAGVKIKRHSLVQRPLADPFLLLDEIRSDDAEDFIAGFPPHPHRGIETLTYMKKGGIRHQDHMGNTGEVMSGGVQWMRAGKGVIHGEMPLKDQDQMHGFQLWINLAAKNKMTPADYRDVPATEIPQVKAKGFDAYIIAGKWQIEGEQFTGPLDKLEANAHYADVELTAEAEFEQQLPEGHQVIVAVYEGELQGESVSGWQDIGLSQLAMYTPEDDNVLRLKSDKGGKALILHGQPHREPIASYGPFVMNTHEEIDQAIQDYQNGVLTD